jgi:filamentous hemagglutinin family protein
MLKQPLSVASSSFLKQTIVLVGYLAIAWGKNPVYAQITPDNTLGNESSVVTPDVEIKGETGDRIDGGAVRGANLFHSFGQFNVGDAQRVYFANPAGIDNILSRVTGNDVSNILGTLGVNGGANLFLLNPNGIIFGENAKLDVGGSFVASTADRIQFGEQGFFSATNPEALPLLTVNPSAFFFNQIQAGKIENSSTAPAGTNILGETLFGLRVPDERSLLLLGGDIAIDGGGLHASGGRVELAGVSGDGTVGLNTDGNNLSLSVPEDWGRADISLTDVAFVNTSGEGGGAIQVWGKQVQLNNGSQIAATTLGTKAGRGLTVNSSESVKLTGTTTDIKLSSGLFTQTGGTGDAGDLTINTKNLFVEKGARVLTGTFSQGKGGDLTANVSESVQMSGATEITSSGSTFSSRMASDTGAYFGSRLYRNPLIEQTSATGKGGNLAIATKQLRLVDGAQIGVSTRSEGDAGNLTVNASESVQSIGFDPIDSTPSGLFSETQGKGNAGNITINTGSVSIINSQSGSFSSGQGNAGNLTVRASDSVEVKGKVVFNNIENPSLLAAQVNTIGQGKGGNLTIDTERLSVSNGGVVQATTFGQGDAGNLLIRASKVDLFETPLNNLFPTGIFAGVEVDPDQTVTLPKGNGGNLTIETDRLSIRDGATVSVATAGEGNAGTLRIRAPELVEVLGTSPNGNFKSQVTAEVTQDAIGSGGNLSIETGQMIIRDGAEVIVSSQGKGNAGNLEIKAESIRLDNQGQILAETASGNGGNIRLQSQDLLLLRRNSKISTTAGTAQAGGDGGNIRIDTPFIVAFPSENSDITANAFTGRGGRVTIDAQGIFGTQFQPQLTSQSDITASSDFGLSGVVEINTPDFDPSKEQIKLPTEVVDVTGLINQNLCTVGQGSQFIVTGRGGLPNSPRDLLNAEPGWEDWRIAQETVSATSTQGDRPQPNNSQKIVEAQGWTIAANGKIILTVEPFGVTSQAMRSRPLNCQMLREKL